MSRQSATLSSGHFGGKWVAECLNISLPLPPLLHIGYSVKVKEKNISLELLIIFKKIFLKLILLILILFKMLAFLMSTEKVLNIDKILLMRYLHFRKTYLPNKL